MSGREGKGGANLNLAPEKKTDHVAFLKALTGEPIKLRMPKLR